MRRFVALVGILVCFAGAQAPARVEHSGGSRAPRAVTSDTPKLDPRHASFEIDVGALRGQFDTLRVDERGEQVADWAVYGTLYQYGVSPATIRMAMYDKVPFRAPALEEVARWDYGPGRRVVLPGGTVWIFRSEHDPHPEATVARTADRVRMETGAIPDRVEVFAYQSEMIEGTIRVRHDGTLTGADLFSPRFGYVTMAVRSQDDLARWIDAVDDLVHVKLLPGGAVELGGRRFADAPTRGAQSDDVATLYRAHVAILENHRAVEAYVKRVVDAFNGLIRSYNRQARYGGYFETPFLSGAEVNEVEKLLDVNAAPAPRTAVDRFDLDSLLGHRASGLVGAGLGTTSPSQGVDPYGSGDFRLISDPKAAIERLRKKVDAFQLEAMLGQVAIPGAGKRMPEAPGFSLDPQWDVERVRTQLRLLLTRPEELLQRARTVAGALPAESDGPSPVVRAIDAREAASGAQTVKLSAGFRATLQATLASLPNGSSRLSEQAEIALQRLMKYDPTSDPSDAVAYALARYALSEARLQCARYDGPLGSTNVGMVLFYTDLLAKEWAGLNYRRSAPLGEVQGFQTIPDSAGDVEATYWAEDIVRSQTRLWFAPKPDGWTTSGSGDELDFGHVASRVYSAGSDPLRPGREATAAEDTRRVLAWWDRRFEQIADYEQQYHAQNQIMKWSVVTGWLAAQNRLAFLKETAPTAQGTFDQWYTTRDDLRARDQIRLRPRSEWLNGTECLDLLSSRPFIANGRAENTSGGVSLASARDVDQVVQRMRSVPAELRTFGISGEVRAGSRAVKTANGTTFEFSRHDASVGISVPTDRRVRGGGLDLSARDFRTTVSSAAGGTNIAVRAGSRLVEDLHIEKGAHGPRLTLTDGLLGHAESKGSALAKRLDRESLFPGSKVSGLTTVPGLAPEQGTYLVRRSDQGLDALVFGDKRGEDAGKAVVLTDSKSGRSAKAGPIFTVADSDSALSILIPNKETKVVAALETPQRAAASRLDHLRWQTLHVGREGAETSSTVDRVFSERPSADATVAVRLHTGSPKIPVVEARVGSDSIALARPTGGKGAAAFNDLFTDLKVDAAQIRQAIRESRTGVTDIQLGAPAAGGSGPGPDDAIANAYAALAMGRRDETVARAGTALGSSRPSAPALEMARQAARSGGDAAEVSDYLFAQAGLLGPRVPPAHLEVRGHAVHLVAEVQDRAVPVSREEVRKATATGDANVIYVKTAAHMDWDASPGETRAKVIADPSFHWARIDSPGVDALHPTELLVGQDRLVRRAVGADLHGLERAASRRHPIFVAVQSCDLNGDGVVDDAERSSCAN